jgi:hypothetical protein
MSDAPISFRPWKRHSDDIESNEQWFDKFQRGDMFKRAFKNSVNHFLNFLFLNYRSGNSEQAFEEMKKHAEDGDEQK